MKIDWLEFSVFIPDGWKRETFLLHVIELLGFSDFEFEEGVNKFYSIYYNYEGIISFSTGFRAIGREIKDKKGNVCVIREHIHIKFTSKGLDVFKKVNNIEDDVRGYLVTKLKDFDVKCSRIDIAKDTSLHLVEKIISNLFLGNYAGFRSWNQCGNNKDGMTAYLGSRKSEKYVRVYEKDKESKECDYEGDRIELVLKNKYATQVLFSCNFSLKKIFDSVVSEYDVLGILQQFIDFSDFVLEKISNAKSLLEDKMRYIISTYGNTIEAFRRTFGSNKLENLINSIIGKEIRIRWQRMANNEIFIRSRAKKRYLSEVHQLTINDTKRFGWV